MDCKEFRETYLDRYLDEDMNSQEIREFREHMSECESCRDLFKSYKGMINYQRIRATYQSSGKGKVQFMKKVKRRRNLPYQLVAGVAVFAIGFFGVKTYFDFNRVNQRYETIVNKSVEMLNTASKNEKEQNLNPKSASTNQKQNQLEIETDRIYNLLNDSEK